MVPPLPAVGDDRDSAGYRYDERPSYEPLNLFLGAPLRSLRNLARPGALRDTRRDRLARRLKGRDEADRSGAQHRDQVERALEPPAAQREVPRRDRGPEPVVERAREAEPRVHRVPAQPLDGELVHPEPARMEEPEQLDAGEVAAAQRVEL